MEASDRQKLQFIIDSIINQRSRNIYFEMTACSLLEVSDRLCRSWSPAKVHCTVVEGGDKTYLATFDYWFKFRLFGYSWIYFDRIQALKYFWMMIYEKYPFFMVFSRNNRFCAWSADTWDIMYFLSSAKCKKVWKFHSLPFGGTVLSPPPYITRPLCRGT